jgi:hypothetical protein
MFFINTIYLYFLELSEDEAAELENSLADNIDIEIVEEEREEKENIKSNKSSKKTRS